MKKLFIGLFVLVLLAVIAGVGALYYIKPDQNLNLVYEKIPLTERAINMVIRLSPELSLTEEDINNLSKQSIVENPQVEKEVVVTGANFTLHGDLLIADLNVVWKNWIFAGLQVTYRLHWENPNLIAKVENARIKGVSLPTSTFSDRVIPVAQKLPKLLKIKDIVWGDRDMKVIFQKPTLQDIKDLMG